MSTKLPSTDDSDAIPSDRTAFDADHELDAEPLSAQTQPEGRWKKKVSAIQEPFSRFHRRTPYLKRVPGFVFFPITAVAIVNCAAWAIVGIILRYHPYRVCVCS